MLGLGLALGMELPLGLELPLEPRLEAELVLELELAIRDSPLTVTSHAFLRRRFERAESKALFLGNFRVGFINVKH